MEKIYSQSEVSPTPPGGGGAGVRLHPTKVGDLTLPHESPDAYDTRKIFESALESVKNNFCFLFFE